MPLESDNETRTQTPSLFWENRPRHKKNDVDIPFYSKHSTPWSKILAKVIPELEKQVNRTDNLDYSLYSDSRIRSIERSINHKTCAHLTCLLWPGVLNLCGVQWYAKELFLVVFSRTQAYAIYLSPLCILYSTVTTRWKDSGCFFSLVQNKCCHLWNDSESRA